jgi:hypothetical protein
VLSFTKIPQGALSTITSLINKFMPTGIFGYDKPLFGGLIGGDGIQGFKTGKMTELSLRCSAVSLPTDTVETVQVDFRGHKSFYPGRRVFDNSVSVSFTESQEMMVAKLLYNWMQNVRNIDDGRSDGHMDSGYLGEMVLLTYAQDGTGTSAWEFKGVWPSSRPDVSFSGSGVDLVTVTVTFAFAECLLSQTGLDAVGAAVG